MSVTIGQKAPDFSVVTDEGPRSLDDYKGKRLVLYFYPKDDTSGCTSEAQQFRDEYLRFTINKAEILGVSKDSIASHEKFRAKHNLPFPLVSDSEGALCEAFGVWKEKSMYGKKHMGIERSTILIDEDGLVRAVWRKVKVSGHIHEILAALHDL
ncbi:peroxiredoxin [Magnetospirillum sulfuroxidans]|uniref:thioredoxin-dependent peroxiredoxin n=1 Tax=Magnetospirillum sulfuroxidans TaxID=611300 RepID=A0ABS5IAY4_9PROT|nr:peroxiredoxin [Magnetospirillum sulfuroxidans]MBR9971585.1 peroxiredoxin [Magnetospirillum sulfuroxidans]